MHTREALGEQAALEVAAQLALGEARQPEAGVGRASTREEGLEVSEQHLVKHAAPELVAAPDVGLAESSVRSQGLSGEACGCAASGRNERGGRLGGVRRLGTGRAGRWNWAPRAVPSGA